MRSAAALPNRFLDPGPLSAIANRAVLELTERASLENIEGVRSAVRELRQLGFRIGYQRARGCVLRVHISDDTVQRLQARRVARRYSETDDVTIEVDSIEEARGVVKSYERFLDDPNYTASIRSAVPGAGT